jgi:plastocyanin
MKKILIGAALLILIIVQVTGGGQAFAAASNNTTGSRQAPVTSIGKDPNSPEPVRATVNATKAKPEPKITVPVRPTVNATAVKPPPKETPPIRITNNLTSNRPTANNTAPFRTTSNATVIKPTAASNEGTIRGIVKAISANILTIGTANVSVVPETKYQVPGIKNATLADIKVGMNITAQIERINGHAYAALIAVVPITRHYVGEVTAYSYNAANGGTITIKDKDGKTYSFEIAAGEFTIQPQGATVKTGEQVTVLTRQVRDEDEPVAIGVQVTIPLEHYSGNVTAFNYNPDTGGNISIEEIGGKTLSFGILAHKFNVQPQGATVKVGSHITVIVQTPPGATQPVAVGAEVVIPTQHFAGKVTEFTFDPAKGGSIAIVGTDGKKLQFDIESGNFTIQPKGASVNVGDTVTVVAKVLGGEHFVATGVVVQPKPVSVKGIINKIDQAGKTITIGTTVVSYDARTIFLLHGVLAVSQGLQATATCTEQPDHTLLANNVSMEAPVVPSPQ